LTGRQELFEDVIKDCIDVFMNMPELLKSRTNFAACRGDSSTIAAHAVFMQQATEPVKAGLSIHTDMWCEDAHFAAISLLYKTAIFTYCVNDRKWYVFNKSGTRGYICLLSTPGHFDVLHGVDGPPPAPHGAYTDRE